MTRDLRKHNEVVRAMNAAKRPRVVAAALLLCAAALTGCANATQQPGPSATLAPTPTSGEFSFVGTQPGEPPQYGWPPPQVGLAVSWVDANRLVFTSWGSSSCYPVPTGIDAVGGQHIRIVTVYGTVIAPGRAQVNDGGPCTSDYGPTSFVFDSPGITSSAPATVTVSAQLPGNPRKETTLNVAPYKTS